MKSLGMKRLPFSEGMGWLFRGVPIRRAGWETGANLIWDQDRKCAVLYFGELGRRLRQGEICEDYVASQQDIDAQDWETCR
jgi:hypothetical protein